MDFYQSLYNISAADPSSSPPPPTLGEDKVLPTLDDETISDLEMLITEGEVARAIATTPSGKSPGPDGFTPEFYKWFALLLTSFLTKVFSSLLEGSVFPPQTLEAHIFPIPKPDKDPTLCANYRPISLIGISDRIWNFLPRY